MCVRVCGRGDRELMRWDINVPVWVHLLRRVNDEDMVNVRNVVVADVCVWGGGVN